VLVAAFAAEPIYYGGTSPWYGILVGHERGLMSWDADWYLRIAEHGYRSVPVEGLRYFPLYPLLARALSFVLAGAVKASLLILSNGFAIVAAVLLYRLCMFEKDDRELARRSVWLFTLAPPAFVLVMGYTEALALTFAIGAFLAMRSGRWGLAALMGVAAGAVRPTGLLLVVPLLVEAVRAISSKSRREVALRALAVVSPLIGTGAYMAWACKVYGNLWLPLSIQQRSNGRGGFQFPLVTFWRAAMDFFTDGRVDQMLHLVWVGLFLALIYLCFRGWPASYGAFALVSFAQAVGTSNLNSLERYAFGAFPVILAAAAWCRTPRSERLMVGGSAAAMTAYATAAFISGYVP
jgi:hypothetical protein